MQARASRTCVRHHHFEGERLVHTPVTPSETLVLTQHDVARVLHVDTCRAAVLEAFRRHGTGEARAPELLGFHVEGGGFHIKVAAYSDAHGEYFVAKTNANFPANPTLRGLPTIQGVVQLFDARSGALLALMDSIEITVLRTAAATEVHTVATAVDTVARMVDTEV